MVSEVYQHQWTFKPVKQDDLQSLHLCFIWSSGPREFPTKQHPTSNRQVEVSWSRVPFGNVPGYQFVSWCVPGTLKKHHAQCILSLYRIFYVSFCSQTWRCIHIHLHLFALSNFEEGIWRFHLIPFFCFGILEPSEPLFLQVIWVASWHLVAIASAYSCALTAVMVGNIAFACSL